MQIKNSHKRNINFFIRWFLGPLLFLWVSWSIYNQINGKANSTDSWKMIRLSIAGNGAWMFVSLLFLMPVNWAIEAWKWRISVSKIQPVSWFTAFKAILSGVAFSITTPNRVGEYFGRILYMEEGNRLKAISLTITGSLSQLIVTMIMGLVGLGALRNDLLNAGLIGELWLDLLVWGCVAGLGVLTLLYFRIAWLVRLLERLPGSSRFSWLVHGLEEFDATLLLQLLSLSSIRYFVFLAQYFLVFRLFGVELTAAQEIWSVSVAFLVMAIIPTIALFTDLGLRGEVLLQLTGLFSANHLGITLATLTIWVVNLIVPALAGSLLILSIRRLFKTKRSVSPFHKKH